MPFAAPEPEPEPDPEPTTSWDHDPDAGLAHPSDSALHEVGSDGGFASDEEEETPEVALAGDEAVDDALDLKLELDEGRASEDDEAEAEEEEDASSDDGGYASLERLSSFGKRANDDLLGSADRLAEEDEDVAPRVARGLGLSPMGKPGGVGGAPVSGATLFERMANLSRGGRGQPEPEPEAGEGE